MSGMTTTGFDTLAYTRRLKAAGVDEGQAEAHAEAVRDAITEGVATKADLANLETRIIEKIGDLKADMLKVAIGIVFANAGLTFALLKLMPQAALTP